MLSQKCTPALLLVAICFAANAQTEQKKSWRFSPLPVVYYSPETKLGFGVLLGANKTLGNDSLTTGSYLQTSFIYTLNKQYEWSNIGRIYSPGNKRIFDYKLYYAFFPEFYYGYQVENPEEYELPIEFNRTWIELKHLWRVKGNLYLGAYGRFNRIYNLTLPSDVNSLLVAPRGHPEYHVAGFSPLFVIDSRDNQVYPRIGKYLEVQWVGHPSFLSDYVYGNLRIDFRFYKKTDWLKDDVIATQFFLNLNQGDIPFRDMADIGGSNTMRGYYRGYYRYKNMYAWQTEYRFMVHRFVGFAAWLGLATLSEDWDAPFRHSVKPSAGLGLRVRINQTDKLNVRADYGFGKNQQGLYLDAAEAF
ncbi:MAG TPA: BamA/TamA family outer membrane protein [Chryseosolibacter sp.]